MGQKDGEKWTAVVDLQPTFPESDRLLNALTALRDSCLQPQPAQRPLFTAIVQCLLSLNTLKEPVDAA